MGVRIEPGPTSTNTRAPSRCIASIISPNLTGPARWSPSRCGDCPGLGGMPGRVEIGIDRPARSPLEQSSSGGSHRLASGCDHRRVKCRRDRKQAGRDSPGRGEFEHLLDGRGRTGNHRLSRAIPVSGLCAGYLANELFDFVRRGENGRHRAGDALAGFPHAPAACLGKIGQRGRAHDASRLKRHQLAVTVASEHIRLTAEVAQQPEHGEAGCADRRLGHVGFHQCPARFVLRLLAISGRWEDQGAERALRRMRSVHGRNLQKSPVPRGTGRPTRGACRATALPGQGTRTPRAAQPTRAGPRKRRREDRRGSGCPPQSPCERELAFREGLREMSRRSPESLARRAASSPAQLSSPRISACDRSHSEGRAPESSACGQSVELRDEFVRGFGLPDQQFRWPFADRRLGRAQTFLSYSSRTAWKLVPPNPNALTPARRGRSARGCSQGWLWVQSLSGPSFKSSLGLGCSIPIVGGKTL